MSLLTEVPQRRRSSRFWIGLTVALVVLGGAAALAYFFLFPTPFSPLTSPAGQALGRAVPGFLVEAQANIRAGGSATAQKGRVSAVLDPKAREALGADGATRLETLLGTVVDIEVAGDPSKELADRFAREAVLFDQTLADRKLPFFVDASIIRSRKSTIPILYSYYIERENVLAGPDKRIRSLFVRRLDDLNFASASVGYTKPSSSAALVLLDHVESQLIEFVLPAVASGDDTLLVDLDSLDPKSPWQRDLRERSASIVKGAYGKFAGADPALVEEIGQLFYRRRALVRSWMTSLDKQRYRLHIPRRLVPEADYANELVGRIPLTELREWRAIHERLMESQVLAAFDAIREEHARSVEQHEAQHQLDYDREKIVTPKAVMDLLGVRAPDDVYDDDFALYVIGEVSAYLAEVVRGPDSPALILMVLSQSAFDRTEWGGAYCYAALAVLTGIAKELGITAEKLVGHGQIDRPALTKLLIEITDKPPQDIRDASRRTWESWYESKLPEVKVDTSTNHPSWRH